MNKIKCISALLLTVLVTISSIIQYHFHDNDGNMHLFSLEKNVLKPHVHNMSSDSDGNYICEHKHQNNTGNDDDSNCSIKLGKQTVSKEFSLKHHLQFSVILFSLANVIKISAPRQEHSQPGYCYILPRKTSAFSKARGLRAPPAA